MKFNEDSRVKIPALIHLTRLGYKYLSLKQAKWDIDTNIFPDIFKDAIERINTGQQHNLDLKKELDVIQHMLSFDDLGKAFYEKLTDQSGIRLIDFEDFNNNTFNVVTELTCKNGDEKFRPDITLLINGMPLVFIEVKKPNNREGILAERNRINTRFQNDKFKKFINITQFMVFSNNMEYDDGSPQPIEGAFYASPSYQKPVFNYFREEEQLDLNTLLLSINEDTENEILKDNNLSTIKHSPEFATNKAPNTPTNRIATSLFSRERLAFILRYGIAYVQEHIGIQKHIMRYPQMFATKAIERKLNEGVKKGIIWHTQGSGKTALTYYNVKFLTDYFQAKSVIPKFYFIVDRLDLLTQAKIEFSSRGLIVHTVNSREEFAKAIKSSAVLHGNSGKPEITVVNIHKFKDDPSIIKNEDYGLNIQRIYFLDEVHRSYNPQGSFLANLEQSDQNAIKIGLTGTPLIGEHLKSKDLFGDYIHKYYYNSSIADGYTLRLIREGISTEYKMALRKALESVEVMERDLKAKEVYAHPRFVEPMLDYIIEDFQNSRLTLGDNSIGGMVVCDSSEQAKTLFEIFNKKYTKAPPAITTELKAAEPTPSYAAMNKEQGRVKTAALILHDIGTKEERKDEVEDFKAGKIDLLFVYNMLLTGFDAKRLKKLYLGRVIKDHNLLQTLTRVNRTYKDFRFGYVVDFADISKEFDKTNKAYWDELNQELGDETESYSHLFKSAEEIELEIQEIKSNLFEFNIENAEIFSQQISQIEDRKQVQELKKALNNARTLYNLIRLFGHDELIDKVDFFKLNQLYREVSNHLDLLNLKDTVEHSTFSTSLLNTALEDVIFQFTKISEDELKLADELKNTLRKTRETLGGNIDPGDPEFITLKEELEKLFKKKKLSEVSQEEMKANQQALNSIKQRADALNQKNQRLADKYQQDPKFVRIHKRIAENGAIGTEVQIYEALMGLKRHIDDSVLSHSDMLGNQAYFEKQAQRSVIHEFKNEQQLAIDAQMAKQINQLIVNEYLNEYNGVTAW
ncbi:MAG: type I restriction endonuclease [Thiomicrorhabdus chilensis]|uniref:type I restriction endonuclease subunit R n=1 Tax=Thiomicrorhabdus chilensis TaxID=63656 RepID=UPI00299DBA52|nr:type I restriction endonuclease [Thiomicrorhabdus chilensis]MDX1346974.1 type I restriction endonuclease [Thiomicrorhabdus chilensis]